MSDTRTLKFPDLYSLGDIFLVEGVMPTYLGQARGAVTVPAGCRVKLAISKHGSADLSCLAGMQPEDLYALSFYGVIVKLDELRALGALTGLSELELGHMNILQDRQTEGQQPEAYRQAVPDGQEFDAALAYVAGMKALKSLSLAATDITDAGLLQLQRLDELEVLDLEATKITDVGLAVLQYMKNLRIIDLEGTGITDAGLANLAHLDSLEVLDLEYTLVTDAGLVHLANFPHLHWVRLTGTALTDEGMSQLKQSVGLKTLELGQTRLSDVGLYQLKGLSGLKELIVTGTAVTPEGIQSIEEALPGLNVVGP